MGCWGSVEEALNAIRLAAPQVTLLDLGLPGMSGIEGIGALHERCPQSNVVILTVYEDSERVFDALCAGAGGYMLKNTPPVKLLDALRDAVSGGAPMSSEIARRVIDVFRRFRPPEKSPHNLTPHELRLLRLLVEGYSYKSAAVELSVSVNTVAFHVQNIYGKLQGTLEVRGCGASAARAHARLIVSQIEWRAPTGGIIIGRWPGEATEQSIASCWSRC